MSRKLDDRPSKRKDAFCQRIINGAWNFTGGFDEVATSSRPQHTMTLSLDGNALAVSISVPNEKGGSTIATVTRVYARGDGTYWEPKGDDILGTESHEHSHFQPTEP